MKKPSIFLQNIEGSGILSICWQPSPYNISATEALNEDGVGFFARNGELLSVIFDDVEWKKDHQVLEFHDYTVEATVKNGKVSVILHEKKRNKRKAA